MQVPPITDIADVIRIERRPYDEFMPYASIFEALRDVALRHPYRRALTFIVSADDEHPPLTWTYREFIEDITRTANLFHALADGAEPRIAMLLPAVAEGHLTLWGGETAGVVCPINFLLSVDHIAELIRAAGANILVALGPDPDLDIWAKVPGLRERCPGLRHVLAVGGAPAALDFRLEVDRHSGRELAFERRAKPDSVAALFHTGGTTGAPKFAQLLHRNQLHAAAGAAAMYASSEHDVLLNGFPLFHVAGAFTCGLSTLLTGGETVLPTTLGMRNPRFVRRYWEFAERHGVTVLAAVPTVLAALINVDQAGARLDRVRVMLAGGSPVPAGLVAAFEQRFGVPVRNVLGMTECSGVISIEPFRARATPGSCGLRLPFTEVLAAADDGQPCAPGQVGTLRLRGPHVGPGYTDDCRNAGTFTEDGWLITGDIGHVDADGRVFLTGRAKDVIIRSGHNIDPGIIEEALLQHPLVEMAAAIGAPDDYAGELPVAFVVLKRDADLAAAELMAFIETRIAERPACPKRIEFLASLPVTAVGKVYKPALRVMAAQQVISDRLAAAGLSQRVRATALDIAAGIQLRFVLTACDTPEVVKEAVTRMMTGFALAFDFEVTTEASA